MTDTLTALTAWLLATTLELRERHGDYTARFFADAAEEVALEVWRYAASGLTYEASKGVRYSLITLQEVIEDLPEWSDGDVSRDEAFALYETAEGFFQTYSYV